MLFDKLDNDFFLDNQEEQTYKSVAIASFLQAHKVEILRAINQAMRDGSDPAEKLERIFEQNLRPKDK